MTCQPLPPPPHVLVVLGDGGHTAEMLRLVELMGAGYRYSYAVTRSDRISAGKIALPGPVWRLTRPRAKQENVFWLAWHLARSLVEAVAIILRTRPDAVLASGPAAAVPVAVAGKLLGAKIIFVETGSRITGLSLTGKILLRFADQFYVQWETLQRRYPQTRYAGRLL